MMNRVLAAALGGLILTTLPLAAAEGDVDQLKTEGQALIGQFAAELKGELSAAMEAGGPENAISVCNEKAPGIAAGISAASGWSVARSSHKLRNPDNAPDAFTAAAIDDFLARIEGGEYAENLAAAAIVEEDGARVFRLVKAIPTAGMCLRCHGGNIDEAVAAKLDELYPEDEARGFSPGQMRGVFTLSKVLD